MSCKKAVRESMFVLVSLHATAVMMEVRVACVAFFICAHRAALFKDCTSPGCVGWHLRMWWRESFTCGADAGSSVSGLFQFAAAMT